jgi:hypothetical protein
MEGSAHASGALVPRWRGVWRRGGNRTLHRGNGHFNSCSVPSYFFGLTGACASFFSWSCIVVVSEVNEVSEVSDVREVTGLCH